MTQESVPFAIEFGHFKLLPHRRELLADGHPVELGGRAFDVLMALVGAHGNVLSKDELMSRAWPGRVIEESALQVQISTLRKVLGTHRDLIKTIAGRGYQFTGDVRDDMPGQASLTSQDVILGSTLEAVRESTKPALPGVETAAALATGSSPQSHPTNLREPISEFIGRDAEVRTVTDLLLTHRLITLTGTGGIGKTRLALAVARQMLPRIVDGVWVAELGPLADPGLVPATVAAALGLTLSADVVTPELVATAIGAKRVLLVLDSCEHLIEAVTRTAEALLSASSVICLLVTSREPLRTDGEWVYPVPALEVPTEGTQDAEGLLRSSAVKLFIERARAAARDFSPDEQMTRMIGRICRRLDGIPLAIELAAVRASALGLEGVAARLDDRFRLLTGGFRTAPLRHQTMLATLDWSYELLSQLERIVLRRVAIFAGIFTPESAGSVAASEDIPSAIVVDCIVNLAAKSLVTVDVGRPHVQYRLLETTRAYGLEKLVHSGEFEQFARRHAEYYCDVFEGLANQWGTRPTTEWLATYGREVDNLRAALDWAFSPNGDTSIAIALTIAAAPLWFQLSLMEECRGRVERALDVSGSEAESDQRRTREQMKLYAALGATVLQTMDSAKMKATWTHTLEIAESLGDRDYALRALWGVWAACLLGGDAKSMLPLAQRFQALAASSTDPFDILIGERILGVSLHYEGDQVNARRHIERMLSHYVAPFPSEALIRVQTDQLRFSIDQRIAARAYLARVLWFLGLPDQAMSCAQRCIDEAEATGHALSLCHGLAHGACAVAILTGNLAVADRLVTMLLDRSARTGLNAMHAIGRCFRGMLVIRHGDLDTGPRLLRTAIDDLDQREFALFRPGFLCALGEALVGAGRIAEGRGAIDDGLERCERDQELWCIAELLRVKGELELQAHSPTGSSAAEGYFLQSIDWARRQNALSSELRAAMSLARLRQRQNRIAEGRKLLATVYDQFTEGFETGDLRDANALLESIA